MNVNFFTFLYTLKGYIPFGGLTHNLNTTKGLKTMIDLIALLLVTFFAVLGGWHFGGLLKSFFQKQTNDYSNSDKT